MSTASATQQFPFTEADAATCDAIIEAHRRNTNTALPAWLHRDEELRPERYDNPELQGPAGLAAWDFFTKRCEALGISFDFAV